MSRALPVVRSPQDIGTEAAANAVNRIARGLAAGQFQYLEGCVRQEAPYSLRRCKTSNAPLIYLSFGSLGEATYLAQR